MTHLETMTSRAAGAPAAQPVAWRPLIVILAVYAVIGAQYAVLTPAWQTPDEPAHYNVVRQIAETGELPMLEPGDYDQKYLEQLTARRFPPDLPVDRLEYQDYQPPLYYLLAAPVFWISDGRLAALRLFSLALGAGVIVFAYLAVRELAGPESAAPLLAAAFIAFIPQHLAMLAGVNNDSLSELVIAFGLWLVLRLNRLPLEPWVLSLGPWTLNLGPWALGLTLGVAFLTKVQAYVLAPVFGVFLLLRWRSAGRPGWRGLLRDGLIVFGVALALGGVYWGRNWLVCGPLDFLCGRWHDQVVVGQPRTADWVAQFGATEVARRFFQTTFQSFWGQFGWMGVVMDRRVYQALLVFSLGLATGALAAARRWGDLSAVQRDGVLLLAVSGLVSLALYLYYNLEFVQHQGRYLFPALIPLGAAAAAGLQQWAAWVERLVRRRVGWLVPLGVILALAALCVFALYRFILPTLA